jgi:formate dehydrogenase major subunit
VYSVGWTRHTVGVQYIRTAAIIQMLLGNVGRPGGGIVALRGAASTQGSTNIPTLWQLMHVKTAAAANEPTVFWE